MNYDRVLGVVLAYGHNDNKDIKERISNLESLQLAIDNIIDELLTGKLEKPLEDDNIYSETYLSDKNKECSEDEKEDE